MREGRYGVGGCPSIHSPPCDADLAHSVFGVHVSAELGQLCVAR